MGRATIQADHEGGSYTVTVRHDVTAAARKRTTLIANRATLQAVADAAETTPEVRALVRLQITAIDKELARLDTMTGADYSRQAWCVDMTDGLSGDVGTIEPNTAAVNVLNIRPGFDGGAAWDPARDGDRVPFLSLPVADAMHNFALMPAIQKWRPTYRYGTITAIDYDANTCAVALDAAASQIRGLNINQASAIEDVPIEYMSCNAGAFGVGDKIVVEFSGYNWTAPKVIGFQDNPQPCEFHLRLVSVNGFTAFSSGYKLRVTQPVASTITGDPLKGTYTEDFTILGVGIGTGEVDANGVVEIEFAVAADPTKPINVQIAHPEKWRFWTEDWRGSRPNQWVKLASELGAGQATWYGTEPAEWDYRLDVVDWVTLDIDLRAETPTTFVPAGAVDEVDGYDIAATGLQYMRERRFDYFDAEPDCAWAENSFGLIEAENREQAVLVLKVPDDRDGSGVWELFNPESGHTVNNYFCTATTSSHQCGDGDYGETYQTLWIDETGPSGWGGPYGVANQSVYGAPGVLVDRHGDNAAFETNYRKSESEQGYDCRYAWAENVSPNCETGEQVEAGGAAVSCGLGVVISIGRGFEWTIEALDAENV
jgi:hypothetical protein